MTKTVLRKMGLKPGMSARVTGLPEDLAPVFAGVPTTGVGPVDWLAAFVPDAAAIRAFAAGPLRDYREGGHLWLCYPKKGGTIRTGITRDHGWGPLHEAGFLPVTQVAVDATWSALRFRRRGEIRTLTRKSPTGG
jgi:hypothetical protein